MNDESKETLGTLIDRLDQLRDFIREQDARVNKAKKHKSLLEEKILELANEQGLSKATGNTATMSISRSIVPSVTDWDKVNKFVLRHKRLDMFQKRLSAPVYRELLETHTRGIPGLESREDVRVNLRKIS